MNTTHYITRVHVYGIKKRCRKSSHELFKVQLDTKDDYQGHTKELRHKAQEIARKMMRKIDSAFIVSKPQDHDGQWVKELLVGEHDRTRLELCVQ